MSLGYSNRRFRLDDDRRATYQRAAAAGAAQPARQLCPASRSLATNRRRAAICHGGVERIKWSAIRQIAKSEGANLRRSRNYRAEFAAPKRCSENNELGRANDGTLWSLSGMPDTEPAVMRRPVNVIVQRSLP